MGTTFVVISVENNPPKISTNRCFWSLSSWLLPLLTPKNSPLSTKNQLPSSSAATVDETGKYAYSFEGANGIKLNEEGEQKRIGNEPEEIGTVSRGSYSYEMDGVTYTV